MRLYEFQGKRLFKEYGLPIPNGTLITSPEEAGKITPPVVLKAQVLVGGRGKAGGVTVCSTREEVKNRLADLFQREIKGEPVRAVLAEDRAEILKEFYLALTLKGSDAKPVFMASAAGGVDIEKVAAESPEKIIMVPLDPFLGPKEYQVRALARGIGYDDHRSLKKFVDGLYAIFTGLDATLVEINPLALTPRGLLALDAKVILDDKAAFRHEDLVKELRSEQNALTGCADPPGSDTITYVPLAGSVGLISDGAGTGMLTLDLINDAGGEAANFCEMGGITNPDVMYAALAKVLSNPAVKSVLVVLIGGFNRMDEMAAGILKYRDAHGLRVPVVVRMCGTMEEEGKEMMRRAGLGTYDDLLQAVREAVRLAEVDR